LIEWEIFKELPLKTNNNEIRGWAILDLVSDEEKKKEAHQEWLSYTNNRPILNDSSEVQQLEDEADWIQQAIIQILDKHARTIRICARSKRWWNEKIEERMRELGIAKRRRKQGKGSGDDISGKRRALQQAKLQTWEDFLNAAEGDNVWAVVRYTKPKNINSMPTIRDEDGIVAEAYEEKAAILARIAFSPPIECNRGKGQPGPEGTAYPHLDRDMVHSALFSQSTKKAPGPDRLGVSMLKCLSTTYSLFVMATKWLNTI
jgi:hypothetical protein